MYIYLHWVYIDSSEIPTTRDELSVGFIGFSLRSSDLLLYLEITTKEIFPSRPRKVSKDSQSKSVERRRGFTERVSSTIVREERRRVSREERNPTREDLR